MEEWSKLGDGSAVNGVKINQTCGTIDGYTHDLDYMIKENGFGECNIRLRSMFDEVLSAFLSERCGAKCFRPVPVLCGDGRPVDLFKLFWVVRKIGGYAVVCRKNLWGFIAVQCGLGFGSIASIKLVYVKYLNEFDQWLWNRESCLEDEESGICQKLDLLWRELEARFRGSLLSEGEEEKMKNELAELECDDCGKDIELDNGESEGHWSAVGNFEEIHVNAKHRANDDDEKVFTENDNDLVLLGKRVVEKFINEVHDDPKQQYSDNNGKCCSQEDNDIVLSAKTVLEKIICKVHKVPENHIDNAEGVFCAHDHDNIMVSSKNVVEKILDSRKRRRESSSLLGMLNWLKHVARHSDDPSVGRIPEFSKWKDHGTDKLWVQALLARESRLIRRHTNLNAEESPLQQKKLRMHPSMYEDEDLNDHLTERLRGSRRFSSQKVPRLLLCCNSCSATQTETVNSEKTEPGTSLEKPAHKSVDVLEANMKHETSMDESPSAHVSVGPLFQAEVPEWAGMVSDSDSKWLGIQMWPPEDGKDKTTMELLPIGKGRNNSCECPFPDSVECVRFHIAERRLKLKLELSSLFYRWRFDRMGEEVSLSWTKEEENRFKDMVRLNAASQNKFWNNFSKILHSKTREMLVSYYFNVYLVQRRSYQNRVTPKDIDSDDDEKQVGSVGELFGYKALNVPGSELLTCTLNKECTDLE